MCSSGLLAMLFACGQFKNNPRLHGIAAEIVEARRLLEEDIGDRVQDMLLCVFSHQYCTKRKSKEPFSLEYKASSSTKSAPSRNKIARTDKDFVCNINENGIDITHDDVVHVTDNIIEYDDNGVDETTQNASEDGETQDFRISQATLVEVQQGSGYEQSKEHRRDDQSEDQRMYEATAKADTVNNRESLYKCIEILRVIRCTTFHDDIVTKDENKSCVPVLLKRRFDNTGHSVPCGYAVA
ncbi:hypothetical protein EAI_05725 [Harpegnathos saltator]|uniref:Uncharacterized protein n=1 Tax=Harpegnathos saltator TaxID=610380 RepID=E2C1R8_HARSA|nr:hypothetical protein EAI_05725 [Harpegnathos saltator]